MFPFQPAYNKKYLQQLTEKNVRIKNIILHSAPSDEIYSYDPGRGMGNIVFIKKQIDSNQHCGIINKDYFITDDPRTFGEFKYFNSCLNRKIGIDENGNIKNCPTLPVVYGNIRKDKIKDSITDQFKQVWTVNKDQIDICKVCEFRYVCSDCRAFTNQDSPVGKPSKCGYDPYQMEWN
jgi:SPASM domain peptide maturase of grasp-with-spasm system